MIFVAIPSQQSFARQPGRSKMRCFAMKPAGSLQFMWLVTLGFTSCASPALLQKHHTSAPASDRPDYSARRIGGRQTLQLPEIGTLHADRIENVPGGEVNLTGHVFLEISNTESMMMIGRLRFAYADQAVWNPISGELSLQGDCVVESTHATTKGKTADTRFIFSRDGRMTTIGAHETLLLTTAN
ncbi:MAG: hypothetical protein U1F71_16875 [Verrucomicrobiaceae bacterium]